MRVLHVVEAGGWRGGPGGVVADGAADDAAALCGAVLARADRHEHRCLVLGPAWFARRARSLGLTPDRGACPPAQRAWMAWRAVRAAAARMAPEAVCCWSHAAEAAATLALGRSMPVVRVVLEGASGPRRFGAVRREVVEVPALGVPPVRAAAGDRAAVRRELALKDDDVAVLLLGNRGDASAMRFEFALGLSRHTGTRVVGVLPAWADSLGRAHAFQKKLEHTVRLASYSRPRREVIGAVDLAAWTGGGRSATWPAEGKPSRMQVAECLAAGVPVVAPARMGVEDLYPESALAVCMAEVANPPEVARRLIPLVEDRALRAGLANDARVWWVGRNGLDAFGSALAEALVKVTHTGGWAEVVTSQMTFAPLPRVRA